MNTTITKLLIVLALFAGVHQLAAQGTAFTYQGRLNDGTNPATGLYDFQFSLSNAPSGGSQVGSTLTKTALAVTNGLFITSLDFGPIYTGNSLWLGISVRTNGAGSYVGLGPLQPLTPTPYAIFAEAANASGLSGTIPLAQLPAGVVTNGGSGTSLTGVAELAGGNAFTGNQTVTGGNVGIGTMSPSTAMQVVGTVTATSFSGNGVGLTGLNLASVNSQGLISFATNYSFNLASSPVVGNGPQLVVAADVNGDGKLDLISANDFANTLTVLTNNGSGGFALANTLSVGSQPVSVAVADVNGDGRPDLISANINANTLTVLTNNGSGGFVLASTLSVGNGPYSVLAADVNGDGKPDLISANAGANTLTVLTNNGSGGFVLASTLSVGNGPQSVVAADVNGDGRPDLISANWGASTLTVLTNNGSGGFALAATLNVGSQPWSVVAADVNGDGKPDLISVNSGGNTLTVLTNNGSGGFVLASTLNVGSYPFSVAVADVNGDGRPDLISANFNANTLTVLTNNGSGGFALAATLSVGSNPSSVVAADVNGDGKVDLISANQNASTLTVLTNTATIIGTFTGNGSGLTALNAAQLTGTVADAQLSANVALRAGGNAFTGNQTFTSGSVSIGGPLHFPGAGADTSTPVFTHKVTTSNVTGNKSYINNPICNGQPNAILIVTENWSASDNVGNSKVVGVYYDAGAGEWTIFVDDGTAMPVGVAYNVMVTLP